MYFIPIEFNGLYPKANCFEFFDFEAVLEPLRDGRPPKQRTFANALAMMRENMESKETRRVTVDNLAETRESKGNQKGVEDVEELVKEGGD